MRFVQLSRDIFNRFTKSWANREELKSKRMTNMLSALFPADWEKFCFQEIQKDRMKNFINAESTDMIGKKSQQAKSYMDVFVNYPDKRYLDEWLVKINTEKSGGVQPGVLAAVREEFRDCRVALAGAKIAKTIKLSIPKLDHEATDFKKKKKRDAAKAARVAIQSIGVEADMPALVVPAQSAV